MNNWRKIGRTQKMGCDLQSWTQPDFVLTAERTHAIIQVLEGQAESDTLTEEELKWLEQKVNNLVTRKIIEDHLSQGGSFQQSSSVH